MLCYFFQTVILKYYEIDDIVYTIHKGTFNPKNAIIVKEN